MWVYIEKYWNVYFDDHIYPENSVGNWFNEPDFTG